MNDDSHATAPDDVTVLEDLELRFVSLVDDPVNPDCRLTVPDGGDE